MGEIDESKGEWRCRCPRDEDFDKSCNLACFKACSLCGAERPPRKQMIGVPSKEEDEGARDLFITWHQAFMSLGDRFQDIDVAYYDIDEAQKEAWRALARRVGWCGNPEESLARHRVLAACEAWYPTFPHDKTWNIKQAITAWIRGKTVRSE